MRSFRMSALVLLGAAVFCTLTSCVRRGDPGLKVGATAPKVDGAGWLNGDAPKPESLKGKVIVVNAWTSSGSRRGPCKQEAKHLRKVYQEFASRGVVFLGMTSQGKEELARIKYFLEWHEHRWPNAYGAGKSLADYKVKDNDLPAVWVIGKDGKIVWNWDHRVIEVSSRSLFPYKQSVSPFGAEPVAAPHSPICSRIPRRFSAYSFWCFSWRVPQPSEHHEHYRIHARPGTDGPDRGGDQ